MHATHRPALEQQKQIQRRTEDTDSYAFFNLLTNARLFDTVEELLPEHRERPPDHKLGRRRRPCRCFWRRYFEPTAAANRRSMRP